MAKSKTPEPEYNPAEDPAARQDAEAEPGTEPPKPETATSAEPQTSPNRPSARDVDTEGDDDGEDSDEGPE